MVCAPPDSAAVEHIATPLLFTATDPHPLIGLLPSENATAPESATVALLGETVAVKVTDWFTFEGLGDEFRTVVDATLLTVCVDAVLVAVLKLESPLYTAVTELEPASSA